MIENRNNDFKNSDGIHKVYSIFLITYECCTLLYLPMLINFSSIGNLRHFQQVYTLGSTSLFNNILNIIVYYLYTYIFFLYLIRVQIEIVLNRYYYYYFHNNMVKEKIFININQLLIFFSYYLQTMHVGTKVFLN